MSAATVHAADSEWGIDTAVLYYAENDGCVAAFEPTMYASKELGDGELIDLRLVVDVLTGLRRTEHMRLLSCRHIPRHPAD